MNSGYDSVKLIGVGKSQHFNYLSNWTNNNDASVCADGSGNPTWSTWDASQRDLFVIDSEGSLVFHENITTGIPNNLESLIVDLMNCDPSMMCGQVITCCDGLLYPTTCCEENCDDPIGTCGDECIDGEMNNDNPCNPMECWDGQWQEIVIDCAEQMGMPCEGGVYVDPPEDVCCSTCVQYGVTIADGALNVLDVVSMVSIVLDGVYDEVSDVNVDGAVNVLDIVTIVGYILG